MKQHQATRKERHIFRKTHKRETERYRERHKVS